MHTHTRTHAHTHTHTLQVLVEALEMARGATQSNAAAAVGNLAHDHSDNKARIAAEPGALAALVSALLRGSDDCRSCVCMHMHVHIGGFITS